MSNNKQIPAAEEFLKRDESGVFNEVDITQAMIEFAKLHVQAQTETILERIKLRGEHSTIDQNIIINAYSLSNIK